MQGLPLPSDRFGDSSGFGVALLFFGVAAQSLFGFSASNFFTTYLTLKSRDAEPPRPASARAFKAPSERVRVSAGRNGAVASVFGIWPRRLRGFYHCRRLHKVPHGRVRADAYDESAAVKAIF